ncbi:MAG: hypothetical protein ABI592_14940 [Acidobacteriota bacterium]
MRLARIFAFFLDLLVCAACADAAGLAATAAFWWWLPGALPAAVPVIWAAVGASAVAAFLLRDAAGGRARRWLGLEAVGRGGTPPGRRASVRRNLPLLIPLWNIVEAWPVLRDGDTTRPADRRLGIVIRHSE